MIEKYVAKFQKIIVVTKIYINLPIDISTKMLRFPCGFFLCITSKKDNISSPDLVYAHSL